MQQSTFGKVYHWMLLIDKGGKLPQNIQQNQSEILTNKVNLVKVPAAHLLRPRPARPLKHPLPNPKQRRLVLLESDVLIAWLQLHHNQPHKQLQGALQHQLQAVRHQALRLQVSQLPQLDLQEGAEGIRYRDSHLLD